jgi:hypothetical protein
MVDPLSGTMRGRPVSNRNSNRTRLIAATFVAAAVAVPLYAATVSSDSAQVTAAPACLAWFGNQEDGKCLSYSNGQPVFVGTPDLGIYGPDAGTNRGGIGVSTGPLLPSQTWTTPIG